MIVGDADARDAGPEADQRCQWCHRLAQQVAAFMRRTDVAA